MSNGPIYPGRPDEDATNTKTAPVPPVADQPGRGRVANPGRDARLGPVAKKPSSRVGDAIIARKALRDAHIADE